MTSRLPGTFDLTSALDSDDWYTPAYIIEALGVHFDLDPCSPPGGVPTVALCAEHPPAVFTEADDGLAQRWYGTVWLNPPYSDQWPWVEKLVEHGIGVALVTADTSTKGWHRWAVTADAICFISHRVRFIRGSTPSTINAPFASALLGFGAVGAAAVRGCGLGWVVNPGRTERKTYDHHD